MGASKTRVRAPLRGRLYGCPHLRGCGLCRSLYVRVRPAIRVDWLAWDRTSAAAECRSDRTALAIDPVYPWRGRSLSAGQHGDRRSRDAHALAADAVHVHGDAFHGVCGDCRAAGRWIRYCWQGAAGFCDVLTDPTCSVSQSKGALAGDVRAHSPEQSAGVLARAHWRDDRFLRCAIRHRSDVPVLRAYINSFYARPWRVRFRCSER